jgi:hypothetical protein
MFEPDSQEVGRVWMEIHDSILGKCRPACAEVLQGRPGAFSELVNGESKTEKV